MKNWYALHVKANHERVAGKYLDNLSTENFIPLYRTKSRRRDRRAKPVDRPLFPGYVFVRVDIRSEEKISVIRSPGAVKLVTFEAGNPSVVPDEVIDSLRILVRDGTDVQPHPYLETGQRVRIIDGPFRDATGFLERRGRKMLLVVTIELLGRSVSVPVDEEAVERIH